MAFPAVQTTAETAVSSAGTSHVINLPASIAAGDLLLLVLAKGSVAATVNAHADWSELLDENAATGFYIAYRWATGSEGATTTLVTSASTRSATVVYRISGAENPATQAPQIGTTATGSSVNPDPPAVTPTGGAKDYLWIAALTRGGEEADDDTWVTSAPSTFTGLLQKACGVAGTNLAGMVATAQLASNAASLNPGTFTIATGAWRAQTVAVHPRSAVTHSGASALSLTAGVTTAGARTRFGTLAVAESVGITTAGIVSKPGAATLTEAVAVATVGRLTAKTASSVALSVSEATVGKLTARGATTLTETVAVSTVATRSTFATAAVAETVTVASAGTLEAKSAAALTETVAASSAGTRDTFAAVSRAETVAITTAGTVSTGATTHFGATSLTLTNQAITTATVSAFGRLAVTLTVNRASTGWVTMFSSASLLEAVNVTTAGSAGATTWNGSTSLSLTVAVRTNSGYGSGVAGHVSFFPVGHVVGARAGRVVR